MKNSCLSIKREKFVLRELNANPFVMNLKHTFQDHKNLYVTLQNFSMENLKSRIKSKLGLHNNEFNFYAAEIIVALKMIHNKNIIYRNMTPDNIFLSYTGHVVLTNFGYSKKFNNLKKDKTFTRCGTPGYLAPEILLGTGYSYKADIWSLGVTICEILGGWIPFSDTDPQRIHSKIVHGQVFSEKLPKNLTYEMKDLLKKIFVWYPESRISLEEIQEHPVFNK